MVIKQCSVVSVLMTSLLALGCNLKSVAEESSRGGLGTTDAGKNKTETNSENAEEEKANEEELAERVVDDAGSSRATEQTDEVGEDAGTLSDAGTSVVQDGGAALESDGGAQEQAVVEPVECIDGVSVVLSDYVSTQIALSSLNGETLAEHFASTASATTDGLAFALSGDVVVPSSAPASGRVVLLDRFGTNVISWFDPATADNIAQLPVGTGFESNPQDYVEAGELAFVSRWGHNELAGTEEFDDGGDVLLIDIAGSTPSIVDSIVMPVEDDLPARPSGMTLSGGELIVALDRVASDFSATGEAMWVGIDVETQEIAWQHTFEGLKLCGRPALSPNGQVMAAACTGRIDFNGEVEDLAQSVILILDPSTSPPTETARFLAEDLAGEPLQNDVVFASQDTLLFKTQTTWGGDTHNRLMALHYETAQVTELLEAGPDSEGLGQGLVYTGLVCAPGCSNYCLMADGDEGVLQRVRVSAEGVEMAEPVVVEDTVGLPPVAVGPR